MTEAGWLTSEDSVAMLAVIVPKSPHGWRPSDRKFRLFACACYRIMPGFPGWWLDSQARWCVEAAEAFADDQPLPLYHGQTVDSGAEMERIGLEILCHCVREDAAEAARFSAVSPLEDRFHPGLKARQAALLRCVSGNPFRPVSFDEHWRTPQVLTLATAAHDERPGRKCDYSNCFRGRIRMPIAGGMGDFECAKCGGTGAIADGTLDPVRLAILADALEEAGCNDSSLLGHLRGLWSCWGAGALAEQQRPITHVRGCWAIDLILGKE